MLKVIELFAGCGGMALGLEEAGFTTELLVEKNQNCVRTLKTNKPDWNVLCKDVAKVDFAIYKGQIDVVSGGFPCQSFSSAGLGLGLADARGSLFFEMVRCIQEVEPKIVLAENVRGLIKHNGGQTINTVLETLKDLGYNPTYKLLRAQFLDVPQKRERVIIIGIKEGLNLSAQFPLENGKPVSLQKALKNCPQSEGYVYPQWKKEIMDLVPPGGCWRHLPIDVQKRYLKSSYPVQGGSTGMARRLSWNEPSLTITCSPVQKRTERCHPEETRPLTVRECARIQTFPDTWQFAGSLSSQYRQIGNAVPVKLAFHIGKCLFNTLNYRLRQKEEGKEKN